MSRTLFEPAHRNAPPISPAEKRGRLACDSPTIGVTIQAGAVLWDGSHFLLGVIVPITQPDPAKSDCAAYYLRQV